MKKIYSLKPFYRIAYSLYVIIAIIYVVLKFQGLLPDSLNWQWNIIVIGYSLIAIVMFYDVLFQKLIISDAGIEHRGFLRNFFLPWSEVAEIPARLAFKVLISKPNKKKKKHMISLYLFEDNPIGAEIGKQIKQYAPHPFEKETFVNSA